MAPPAGLLAWWPGDGNCQNAAALVPLVPHGGVGCVADYVPTDRQVVLGWRNSNSDGSPAIPGENFNGVLCEVLV